MSSEQHDYDPDDIHRVANCRKCQADLALIDREESKPEPNPSKAAD